MSIKLLRDQKEEYLEHLFDILYEPFIRTYQKIYDDVLASKECNAKNVLKLFQQELSKIPEWNQIQVDKTYETILSASKCTYFPKLLKAVYILTIKIILLGIPKEKRNKVQLKVPSGESFIHRCLIHMARDLWKRPYLFYHLARSIERQNNLYHCEVILKKKIKAVLRETIPMDWIIDNITSQYKDDSEEEPISSDESESEEESESSDESDSANEQPISSHESESEEESEEETPIVSDESESEEAPMSSESESESEAPMSSDESDSESEEDTNVVIEPIVTTPHVIIEEEPMVSLPIIPFEPIPTIPEPIPEASVSREIIIQDDTESIEDVHEQQPPEPILPIIDTMPDKKKIIISDTLKKKKKHRKDAFF